MSWGPLRSSVLSPGEDLDLIPSSSCRSRQFLSSTESSPAKESTVLQVLDGSDAEKNPFSSFN